MTKALKRSVALIILDGWGYREDTKDNAIAAAHTPNFDKLWNEYPHTLLKASGHAVGLPEGQMGNSEVGHMTIGAGTPIDTDLVRIDKAISTGEFEHNQAFLGLFDHVKKYGSTLHVMGLLSTGGVHSHSEHLYAFLRLAKSQGVPKVAIHVFTDGRDTPPQSASGYLKSLEAVLDELGPEFFIATISGRYYAMDRDGNWDRLAKAEKAMFECQGETCDVKPSAHMDKLYQKGEKDELLPPMVCATPDGRGCAIGKDDGVLFFNFRADRARMLTKKLLESREQKGLMLVTLTEYSRDLPTIVAFPASRVETTLGAEIAAAELIQSRIAETEKFPHATYFLNGGRNEPHPGQRDIMLPSRKDVRTHDEAPEMRAEAIADKAIEEIGGGETSFIFINFANPDMVGHTANVPAIEKAIETVDKQLSRVLGALEKAGGIAIVTADHGNAELNVDQETGDKHTAHTLSLVPCVITDKKFRLRDGGGLADLAPTILSLLKLDVPKEMTGRSLIV